MLTVSNVERLCLDTTPGKRTEGWHQGEGTGRDTTRSEGFQWHRVAVGAPFQV